MYYREFQEPSTSKTSEVGSFRLSRQLPRPKTDVKMYVFFEGKSKKSRNLPEQLEMSAGGGLTALELARSSFGGVAPPALEKLLSTGDGTPQMTLT